MKGTIVPMPALRLVTSKSKSFPEGNREAFQAIESPLETLRGRKFYGVVFGSESGMDYYAGLVPESDAEEGRFADLGFPILEIAAGIWARVKLIDWQDKMEQIGPIMGSIIAEHGMDPARPQLEFYRSSTELHLLVPIAEPGTGESATTDGLP